MHTYILCLKQMLFRFGKRNSSFCSFWKKEDEAAFHFLYDRTKTKHLQNQVNEYMGNRRSAILLLTSQSAFLGFIELSDYFLMNHLTFFFKFCVYNARSSGYLNIEYLKAIIDKAKNIEREINKHQPNKRFKYLLSGVFLLNTIL